MPLTDLMLSAAADVIEDVAATTDLRLEVSSWVDPSRGIGAVVHEAGTHPTAPVWEAVGALSGGDSMALHPPRRPTEHFPHSGGRADVTMNIADSAQNLVQMLLWYRGLNPAWPPCTEHRGRHPLRVVHRSEPTPTGRGNRGLGADSAARWECPRGTTSIAIGQLRRSTP